MMISWYRHGLSIKGLCARRVWYRLHMHVHIVQYLVSNVFVDFPQHLGHFWGEMWFIDCSCVEHSNLYVNANDWICIVSRYCYSFHFRLWSSLWCAKWAQWSCCKLEEHWYCSAVESWLLAKHWDTIQQWPSCMPYMDTDGVADEELQCGEVWWTNLAAVGGSTGPLSRWSKCGTCKENCQETQGWRYTNFVHFLVQGMYMLHFASRFSQRKGKCEIATVSFHRNQEKNCLAKLWRDVMQSMP